MYVNDPAFFYLFGLFQQVNVGDEMLKGVGTTLKGVGTTFGYVCMSFNFVLLYFLVLNMIRNGVSVIFGHSTIGIVLNWSPNYM